MTSLGKSVSQVMRNASGRGDPLGFDRVSIIITSTKAAEGSPAVDAGPCALAPKTFKQASSIPMWVEAMEAEIEALRGKDTVKVVKSKMGIKPIP